MHEIGQSVDDRDGRGGGELDDVRVSERSDHDAVDVARENFRGIRIGSPRPSCTSRGERKRACPPSCHAPTSKDTRVRVDDFMKIIASDLPASGFRGMRRFIRSASSKRPASSAGVRSGMARKWRTGVIGVELEDGRHGSGGDCSQTAAGEQRLGRGSMSHQGEVLRAALASRYKVDRELGRGAMSLVFLAEDLANGSESP